MKKGVIVLLGLILAVIVVFSLSSKEQRWLFFNGSIAEEYATALLTQNVSYKQPDRFIDYSVSAQGGYVMFSEHSDEPVFYGYFPNGITSVNSDKLQWEPLTDNWYVAHP